MFPLSFVSVQFGEITGYLIIDRRIASTKLTPDRLLLKTEKSPIVKTEYSKNPHKRTSGLRTLRLKVPMKIVLI